jgi:hypothetical protein
VTTVALIRTTYVNGHLARADADTTPWTAVQCSQAITDSLAVLFGDGVGNFVEASVATNQNSDRYTIPVALQGGRISRIELEQTSGGVTGAIDRVVRWRMIGPTSIRVAPTLPTDSTLTLKLYGWAPFKIDASDLPTRLEPVLAWKACALLYGDLASRLANSKLQQGLDTARVVDYPTAVGLSAMWERRYQDAIKGDPAFASYAPRASRR